jgi:hypothetical protein
VSEEDAIEEDDEDIMLSEENSEDDIANDLTLPNDYKDDEEDENSSELDEMELNDW